MNKPCTFLLSALMASAVLAPAAASAADKSELEVRMEAAQKVLADPAPTTSAGRPRPP